MIKSKGRADVQMDSNMKKKSLQTVIRRSERKTDEFLNNLEQCVEQTIYELNSERSEPSEPGDTSVNKCHLKQTRTE